MTYDYELDLDRDYVVRRAPSPGVAAVLSVLIPGLLQSAFEIVGVAHVEVNEGAARVPFQHIGEDLARPLVLAQTVDDSGVAVEQVQVQRRREAGPSSQGAGTRSDPPGGGGYFTVMLTLG